MQLPSVRPPAPAKGKENNRENTKAVPPPSRQRLALSSADSDYSIVAVSVKSGLADADEETKHGEEVEVQVQDKREEHVESSESEYSGGESQCVPVPRAHHPPVKASTNIRPLRGSVLGFSPDSESKLTSSTAVVASPPSPPKVQLGEKTAPGSTGSLHIREGAESVFVQMHRITNVNVGVEQVELKTPPKVTSVLEGLDATPTQGKPAGVANRGKVEPPVAVSSRKKEEVARPDGDVVPYQLPQKSQLLDQPKVELRPISVGFLKDEDIVFQFSEAEHIRLSVGRTIEAPQRVVPLDLNHGHVDAKPTTRGVPPKSGKRPPVAVKDVRPGGHPRRRGNTSSSGSEYEGHTHEHRSHLKEKMMGVLSPDFGGKLAQAEDSSSSRPTTANTTTASSASATGHGSSSNSLGRGPSRRATKRNTRVDRNAFKRTTIVARYVDGSNLGHGVEGDVEDADEDEDDEDDDEFEVETEHGRVLRSLVKEKSAWPSAMSFHDVTSERTVAARAHGYATKINELAKEDCGLKDWIEIWLKPSGW
jgi:hypothetical protein